MAINIEKKPPINIDIFYEPAKNCIDILSIVFNETIKRLNKSLNLKEATMTVICNNPDCHGGFIFNDDGTTTFCACYHQRIANSYINQAGIPERYKSLELVAPIPELIPIYESAQKFVNNYIPSFIINNEKQISNSPRAFFITGVGRSGKTCLSIAMLTALIKKLRLPGLFVNLSDFALLLRSSCNDYVNNSVDIINKYCEPEFLVLDDFMATRLTDFVVENLYAVINKRLFDAKCTIINVDEQFETFQKTDKIAIKQILNRVQEIANYEVHVMPSLKVAAVIQKV